MTSDVLIVVITSVINLSLGAFVLARNPRATLNKLFAFLALSLVAWTSFNFLADVANSHNLLLTRLTFVSAVFIIIAFYEIGNIFPSGRPLNSRKLRAVEWSLAFTIAFICLTPLVVPEVTKLDKGVAPTIGPLYYVFAAYIVQAAVIFIRNLAVRKRKSNVHERAQINLMLAGTFSYALFAIISNLLLPAIINSWSSSKYGPIFTLLFVGFITYAIVKHRLLDIRLLVARTVAYILLLVILVGLYGLAVFGVASRLAGGSMLGQQTASVVAALLLVFTSPYLRRQLDRITNSIFYRDAYDPQEFLDQFNAVLVGNIEIKELVNGARQVIAKNIKSDFALIALDDKEGSIVADHGVEFGIADARELRQLIEATGLEVIQTDTLPEGNNKLYRLLKKYDIALTYALLPNAQDRKIVGYLMLGNKKSGNLYSRADQRLLETIADELAIAVQNALHFQEIKGFSATLQRRVDTATRELRRSNDKLKQLDETKDEFLSMASHQLRTPLTSVKGFISMVLDGDVGPITEQQRKVLEQAFESSQRMVFLIGDFLNVSRIQSGKFVIDKSPFDIVKLVQEEVNQLDDSARARGLEFVYHPPAHMPEVVADKDKLRQVMMNFMDNALYYSPNGGKVTLRLYKDATGVVFKVTDTGIGVPKAEQEKLFSKFFRAKNAQQQRPDGTGIGLYMAKKVIVGHGGSLIFESVEGKGSTFGFRLPLK